MPATATASSTPLLPTSGFQLAEKKGKKNWDALPAVKAWYKAAEKHSTFKDGKKAGDDMEVCLLDVKVEGLTSASWSCPQVEPALLQRQAQEGLFPDPLQTPPRARAAVCT